MFLLFVLISFASGVYPSLILSNLKLIKVLKSGFSFSSKGTGLRKTLIIFQFIVSLFLIISTTIILQQLSYIRHKKLGYDKDYLIVLPVDGIMRANYQSIKDALANVPGVQSVSSGYQEITNISWPDALRTTSDAASTPFLFMYLLQILILFVQAVCKYYPEQIILYQTGSSWIP